jgi:hypothetical protein
VRTAIVVGPAASRRAAAVASVVLQGRAIGGPNLTRPLPPAQSGLPAALAACSRIYVRRGDNLSPLAPLYVEPYTVQERGEKVFRLQVGDREEAVSVDRLKPHTRAEPVQPAAPPKGGQPPGSAASSTTAAFRCQH